MEKKKGRPPIKILSCDEIKSLIQCCKDNNVQEFSFSGLAFKLHSGDNKAVIKEIEKENIQEIEIEEKDSIKNAEILLKNEEVKDLIISDPESYEKMLAQDELVDENEP